MQSYYLEDEMTLDMSGFESNILSQREAERLLRECRDIAQDWDSYLQFCQSRNSLVSRFFPKEGIN